MLKTKATPFWGQPLPSEAGQFLKIAKDPAGSMPLIHRLTKPEPRLLYLALHPRRQCSFASIILGPEVRQLDTTQIV